MEHLPRSRPEQVISHDGTHTKPRPARWRDIPRAAWILSRAFTNESRVGRRLHSRRLAQLHALAATPFYLLIAIYSTVPGHLYLDPSRTGTAVAAPRRSLRSLAGGVAAIAFLVTVGVPLNLASRLEPGYVLELGAGVVATLSVALLLDAMIGSRHSRRDRKRLRPLRRKIPARERWDLMMLAQLPDTKPAAARLARTPTHRHSPWRRHYRRRPLGRAAHEVHAPRIHPGPRPPAFLHRPDSRPRPVARTQQREGPARQPTPPAYSPSVPSATTPTAPAPLRLEQPHRGRAEVEHRRHQCHRHDQRLRNLPTHLLPPSGRASLPADSDDSN